MDTKLMDEFTEKIVVDSDGEGTEDNMMLDQSEEVLHDETIPSDCSQPLVQVKSRYSVNSLCKNVCGGSSLAFLEEGKKAYGWQIKLDIEINVCVDNALKDIYVTCEFIDGIWGVFKVIFNCSIVSRTTMLMDAKERSFETLTLSSSCGSDPLIEERQKAHIPASKFQRAGPTHPEAHLRHAMHGWGCHSPLVEPRKGRSLRYNISSSSSSTNV
ncbi:hypothetical protein V6N11_039161 [Hibiscus sabdariffa]|uniref:Uncharacterized protein n=1 Tax=Hibiscus sabdariffa TaxID=183260 RepID=A0ABR2SM46_9ROSI